MLSFILLSTVLSVPSIKKISVDQLYQIMYEPFGINSTSPIKAENAKPSSDIYFIIREEGDLESGEGYEFYDVSGTKEQIAQFRSAAQYMPQSTSNVSTLNETASNKVIFVQFTQEATYKQEAVFWVVIVTFIIFIGGVMSSLILWHTDRYDLDPANSLLFVTEGNTIVSGINDPK